MFHDGDDLLIGHQDLPDRRHVGLCDGAIHPQYKSFYEEIVEVHLYVDVIVVGVQVLSGKQGTSWLLVVSV